MKRAYLILSDGSYYEGSSFGALPLTCREAVKQAETQDIQSLPGFGEVVFNTSMTGYHEIITDPSYTGQIVLMTYPHIGNYGSDSTWSETDPKQNPSGHEVQAKALVVRDYYSGPVPHERRQLSEFLTSENVPGISGIDTRRLTLSLRDNGSQNGLVVAAEQETLSKDELQLVVNALKLSPQMEGQNLVNVVSAGKQHTIAGGKALRIGLIDCGNKQNIIRELLKRDVQLTLLPANVTAEEIEQANLQALLFSNGPGDPGVLDHQTELARTFLGTLPLYGICLGHQIIARALGASTYKMKFGHHGGNHPVRDEFTGKVFVTAQNHGFAVDPSKLSNETSVWFTNANDGTVEGIAHNNLPVMAVQFHPEAAPGPHDGRWIFDSFLSQAREYCEPQTS
ncbi:MAG: glutamine-hydrolyzing carbamoyl-phosphate synthase small subunit [Spirochaetota bacterium]